MMGISKSHTSDKDDPGHTQEVVVYSVCMKHRLFEREGKKGKDQIMEGIKRLAQDFRLFR